MTERIGFAPHPFIDDDGVPGGFAQALRNAGKPKAKVTPIPVEYGKSRLRGDMGWFVGFGTPPVRDGVCEESSPALKQFLTDAPPVQHASMSVSAVDAKSVVALLNNPAVLESIAKALKPYTPECRWPMTDAKCEFPANDP